MTRIGDILLAHGWVDPKVLERAVARPRGQRLCSFLVENDAVDPDNAARALGEEHGVPAALEKHLVNRERSVAKLVPAQLARTHCLLPLGRTGSGDLIICARDPKPELRELLANLIHERVVLAVALAVRLEPLVAATYGSAEPNEFDVDLTTGPIVSLDDELVALSADDVTEDEVTTEKSPHGEPLAALDALTLVELDDTRVSRDLSQSGVIQIGPQVREKLPIGESRPAITVPPVVGRTATVDAPTVARTSTARTSLMSMTVAHPKAGAPPPPDDGLASGTVVPTRASRPSIEVPSVEQLLDKAIKVAAERWQAVLLLSIKGRLALGHRGHGSQLGEDVVRGVAIPLNQPSIVQAAFETGRLVTTIPDETGAVQGRLERLLSMPRFPAAMPIATGGSVTFILAVGDPVVGEPDAAARELERLGTEFAAALARFAVT
ncbi:MAG: hypothetical protein SFX73_09195 [Kofleriaceae bacterium]|nr:hypothetical protein [Kofleriaceae bacterium]